MSIVNRPVVQLLLHTYQNVDDPEQLLTYLGTFLEGLGKANGMSPERMANEVKRFLDHSYDKPSAK